MTRATRLVIVGAVDHGKSTFTGRLLVDTQNLPPERLEEIRRASEEQGRRLEYAYVTDQFQEERERNVTIDTTQTFFSLDGRPFVLVDAPGHREYLRNMITGAAQARHALLMLDVNEGIREETDKHIRILSLLGIRRLAVLINKMDLVSFDEAAFRRCRAAIDARLSALGCRAEAIIPISAYNGDNVACRSERMAWYAGPTALDFIRASQDADAPAPGGPLRLPVQVVFDQEGRRLVLGRVEQGRLSAGQFVTLFPNGTKATVQRILKFGERPTAAGEGECVAVDLGDVLLRRGDVVTDAAPAPATDIAVHAFWAGGDPLKPGDEILVECRTQTARCRVVSVSDELNPSDGPLDRLAPGNVARLRLNVADPLLVDAAPEGAPLSRLVFHRGGEVVGCGVVANDA